jgi:hypothetical protein
MDDFFVYAGIAVVWIAKGGQGSLEVELGKFKPGEFFRRREGIIGLGALLALFGAIFWAVPLFDGR